jgi:dihydroflavonol-4-reductase
LIAGDQRPVLVTGAGGFVGGHVAREIAATGRPVRGLSRRPPLIEPGDPPIDWRIGDLRDPTVRREVLNGVGAVVHTAGWVSLGSDPKGSARSINVDATRDLLADSIAAGVERFVFTSTLHTLAAGTADAPADEDSAWNLVGVESPYARTKREAERIVLGGSDRLAGVVLCPGMVLGTRDIRPTSTRLLLAMAGSRLAFVPGGGIPVVDSAVIARAHRLALSTGEPGSRYAVVGPYLSYPDLARLVGRVAGRPRRVVSIPDAAERPIVVLARLIDRVVGGHWIDVSAASAAGGFLRLHVRGDRADLAFGLVHPDPITSIFAALDDARRSGRARWLPELHEPGQV